MKRTGGKKPECLHLTIQKTLMDFYFLLPNYLYVEDNIGIAFVSCHNFLV